MDTLEANRSRLETHKLEMSAGAREQMITQNLPLVTHIAKCYSGKGVDFEDLVSEGSIGLMEAVDRFDPAKGKFSPYACCWIKQKMRRALSNYSRTIRLPASTFAALAKADWKPEGNRRLALAASISYESLDTEDAKEVASEPEEKIEDIVLAALQDGLFTLPKRERFIIDQRFAKDKTLEEVGAVLGITRERVRQLQNLALKKLRFQMKDFKE